MKVFSKKCLLSALCPILFSTGLSADIVQISPLDFGEIVIINNSVVSELTVDYLGNNHSDDGILIIRPGQPGQFEASGFAGNVELFIIAQIGSNIMTPNAISGEYPELVSLNVPTSVRTNSNGIASIPVGGVLGTSSSGSVNYLNAIYSTDIQVTINF